MNEDRIKEELIKELKKISSTYDFIIGVLSDAKHVDDRKTLIEYIRNNDAVTYEDIVSYSLELGLLRKGVNIQWLEDNKD